MADTEVTRQDDLIRRFEDAAHEIHGDATEYLAKRSHDGLVEYVRGDVNSSWIFFRTGFEDARKETAKAIAQKLRERAREYPRPTRQILLMEASRIEREHEATLEKI